MLASTRANAPLSAATRCAGRPAQPLLGPRPARPARSGPVRHRDGAGRHRSRGSDGDAPAGADGDAPSPGPRPRAARRAPVHGPRAGDRAVEAGVPADGGQHPVAASAARRRAPWPRARRRGRRRPGSAPRRRWCGGPGTPYSPTRVPRSGPSRRRAWRVATGRAGTARRRAYRGRSAGPAPAPPTWPCRR